MVRTSRLNGYSDVHFTKPDIAQKIVEHFNPVGRCLEPFKGGGAFYQHLPINSRWCEISEGMDFFEFKEEVDWIVTNPPFSNLTQVYEHAFKLSHHCVFLIPISKHFSSAPRLAAVKRYGGLRELCHVGTGRQIGFDIGFPFAAMHFERGYTGPISETSLAA